MRHAHFLDAESTQLVIRNPPSQGLGTLPQQVGRRTAEDQESPPWPGLVGQHAQGRKDLGPPLNLVKDDQPGQRAQHWTRIPDQR